MCGSTRSGSYPEDKGRVRRRLPGELLRPLRRIRLHRRPGGAARPHLQQRGRLARGAARLLARLHRRGRRDQGSAHHARCSTRSTRCSRRISSRRARTAPIRATARPAATAGSSLKLGTFGAFIGCSNYPECRYTRQLAGDRTATAAACRQGARQGPGDRPRRHAASRPLRPLSAARRSHQGHGREAEARRPAEGLVARRHRRSRRALKLLLAAARGRQASRRTASRSWPASAASAPTCSTARPTPTSSRRRRAHHRPQPRGDADRREDAPTPARAAASAPIPAARSASIRNGAGRSWSRTAATGPT